MSKRDQAAMAFKVYLVGLLLSLEVSPWLFATLLAWTVIRALFYFHIGKLMIAKESAERDAEWLLREIDK